MKTKKLLLFIVIFAISLLSVSAQKLLVSENLSTSAWQTEFVRLNPSYTTPAPAATATSFISGFYNGCELFSGTIECGNGLLPCENGSTVHNNGGSAVGWRLKRQSSGLSYLTLPTITSAGNISVHVKSSGTGTKMILQKVDTVGGTPVITDLKTWTITDSGNAKFTTQLDEIKTFWVDSRGAITLRFGQFAD